MGPHLEVVSVLLGPSQCQAHEPQAHVTLQQRLPQRLRPRLASRVQHLTRQQDTATSAAHTTSHNFSIRRFNVM